MSADGLTALQRENETLRQELRSTVDALLALRSETRDEIITYLVKVPAQRGWHRWKKEGYKSEAEAMTAADKAAKSHGRARVVERRSLVRERVLRTAETREIGPAKRGPERDLPK